MPIGAMISSFFSHKAIKKVGRRKFMMIGDVIFILGCGLGMIMNLYVCLASRFIQGFSIGMVSCVVPMYIREISPESISGLTGSIFQIEINIGIILGIILSIFIDQLRIVIAFPSIFAIFRLILLGFIYQLDTPYYYLSQNEMELADKSLKEIYLMEYYDKVREEIVQSLFRQPNNQQSQNGFNHEEGERNDLVKSKSAFNEDLQVYIEAEKDQPIGEESDINDQLDDYTGSNRKEKGNSINALQLKNISQRRRLRIGLLMNIFQQLTGINVLIQFCSNIFQNLKIDQLPQDIIILISSVYLLFAAIIGSQLNQSLGRRNFLFGGFFMCGCIQLVIFSIYQIDENNSIGSKIILIVMVFSFYGTFNCSVGPVVWIFTSDILKEEVLSYSIVVNWLGNVISTLITLLITDQTYKQYVFLFFAVQCFIAAVVSFTRIIETEGKLFKEIIKDYSEQSSRKHQNT